MSEIISGFVCTKCGKCCCGFSESKGVILFPEDLDRISNKLNVSLELFKTEYCTSRKLITEKKTLTLYYLLHVNGRCIFLDHSNLCNIYELRPLQCQKGPFYFLWEGQKSFDYECMKDVKVPENWSTDDEDFKLIATLFND